MKKATTDRAAAVWRWVLGAGFAVVAGINLPGHLPYDSINALWEGRTHVRLTWGPKMYSAILGFFDAIVPGTGLYAVASLAVLFLAWAALPRLRPRVFWTAPIVLALWFAHPEVLIFQGVIWRDVLFANLVVAGFVALAFAAERWERPAVRWPLLALAAVSLAFAGLVRQNGAAVILPAALALGWTARSGGWPRAVAWAVGGLAAPLALIAALDAAAPIHEPPGVQKLDVGLRLLAQYDLAGAVAETPGRPLAELQAAEPPTVLAALRRDAPKAYSPVRSDVMNGFPEMGMALWLPKAPVIFEQWGEIVAADPAGYARRRFEVFHWLMAPPRLELCVPIHLGVEGPPDIEQKLGLKRGHTIQNGRLFDYARRWFPTPLYSHLTFALIAAAAAAALLVRRAPADIVMAALMIGALGFAASFFFVSIACDYRYLYALDLAAITGTLYLAIDPRLRRA
jgi:hypothetical protein